MAKYHDAEVVKYNNIDTLESLANLADAITKVLPNIVLKHEDFHTYGVDKDTFPKGIAYRFSVFHDTDMNNSIGKLFVENWQSKTPKYGIQNVNIDDGRSSWGEDGQFKTSIHAKNIVRIAKKVFKPYTFEQIANRNRRTFTQKIEGIGNTMRWEVRQQTCDGYQHLITDFENLFHMGYKPSNEKFKRMMEYVVENKTRIDKYLDYKPDYYFVLVKDGMVQYSKTNAKTDRYEPEITLKSKDELPEDIKGKLFVLDITDNKDFVEDIGLKENDGAYWIIA